MKRVSIAVLGIFLLAAGAYAIQNPQGPGEGGRGARMGRGPMTVDDQVKLLTGKLQLTDDQQIKVRAIIEDQRQQFQALKNDSSLSQEDRKAKSHSLREASNSKIRDILNDDQKKKFDEMEQQRRERMHERKEKSGNSPSA